MFLKLQAYKQTSVEKRKLDKLSPRYFSPYEIISKIGLVAYTLKLPKRARIHPTFQVSLLKKCPDPSIHLIPLHEDVITTTAEKEPAEILGRRMSQKTGRAVTEALVQWKGEEKEDATWEVWQDLQTKFPNFAKEHHP